MDARRRRLAVLAAAALLVPAAGAARADTVTVFAAASLQGCLDEVARAFEAGSGHRVRIANAATPSLARQIEAGAPAQVFIAADAEWMRHVEDRGLLQSAPVAVAGNALVLVAP
ncbi:MAG TPA: substrate-binding domain-containing protein, partial [Myxococcota bacterium]|nr:substrate-binding domain-containing protein [Myxococcota bacterium]